MGEQDFAPEFRLSAHRLSLKQRLLLTASATSLLLAFGSPAGAQKLPSGANVTYGNASISQPNSSTLNINQGSSQAIINWNSFSIGRGGTVNFNQPGASSSTLNRVTGSTPSSIYGTINAPGTVLLVNPNGIVIGKSGVINTGSFLSSSLGISDDDYKAGRYNFTGNGASARVVNNGHINVSDGGFAALLGGEVANNGVIVAKLGKVALGSGEQATIDLSGDGFLSVAVPTAELGNLQDETGHALVSNKGKIIASGGSVYLSAATAANILRDAVYVPGTIRANSVSGHDGAIYIGGGPGGEVTVTGNVSANGGRHNRGGTIQISGAVAKLRGRITANGASGGTISIMTADEVLDSGVLQAEGLSGAGGEIDLTANDVTLTGATLDASGTTAGGDINIGGGPHASLSLADAQTVSIDSSSLLSANATAAGNGGHIVVWSDGQTDVSGTLSATGGASGGNGGSIETSGESLDVDGITVNASASNGSDGSWLLDPTSISITSTLASTIDTSLNNGTNVTETGSGNGSSITLQSGVNLTWTSSATLSLTDTSGTIVLNGAINATKGGLKLQASSIANSITDTSSVNVGTFTLVSGNWSQSYGSLAAATSAANAFSATNFVLGGGTFLRTAGGTGSAGSPYQIFDVYGLQGMETELGGNFALAQNIDASGTSGWNGGQGFVPIGETTYFSGTLNGEGYTISNLSINAPTTDQTAGLFGYLSGTVSNLNLANATVRAAYPTYATGTLVAENAGTISNVSASGTVTSGTNDVGGLVGVNSASITNATSSVNVTANGNYYTGGLVGANAGSITNSSATGTVTGYVDVGGLIGENAANISNVFATGKVTGGVGPGTNNIGGLIGENSGSVTNAYATGNVVGDSSAADNSYDFGGLIGDNSGALSETYATGSVSGANYVGGLVGIEDGGSIQLSFETGSVQGNYVVGGLVGYLGSFNATTSVTNAYASGNVSVVNSGVSYPGLYGGGLVGEIASGSKATTITDTYAAGKVTLGNDSSYAGGFAGVTSGSKITVTSSYWNSSLNSHSVGSGGSLGGATGETSAALMTQSTFSGWNFTSIWGIHAGQTDPYLAWNPAVAISGTDYSSYGGSAVNGATVDYAINGVIGSGTATTNASGAYTLYLMPGTLNGTSQLLVYTTAGATFDENMAGSVSGLNIYGGYLTLDTASTSANLSSVAADLATAKGSISLPSTANEVINITDPNFAINATVNTGTLVLNSTGAVTQSSAISATNLDLLGGGNYTLSNASNSIGTLAAKAGSVTLADGGSLTIGTVDGTAGVQGSGAITLTSTGTLTIATGADVQSAGVGDDIILSAATNFINDAGANAVQVASGGQWLIYSATPDTDTFDNLNSNNTAIWDTTYPTAVSASGDRYVFAYQPSLIFTSTGSLTKTYGTDDTAAVAGSGYEVTGLESGVKGAFLGDSAASVFSGGPTLASTGAAAGANVNGENPYAITIAQGSLQSLDGYAFSFTSSGTLTVDPATLTYVANTGSMTYGGTVPGLSGTVTGFVNGQNLQDATTGTLVFATSATSLTNVGTYAINGSGLTADNGNYVFRQADANATAFTITPASLTITANNQDMTYGGAGNDLIDGVSVLGLLNGNTVTGETLKTNATKSSTSGFWDAGDWTITASGATGTGLSNYTITYKTGTLDIDPATLIIAASSGSKTYDGTTGSGFAPTVSNLVAGDGVLNLSQSYNSANVLTANTLSVNSGYVVRDGNNGRNYVVELETASGSITPATITLTGTKTYDSTTGFTADDFGINGTILTGIGLQTLTVTGAGFVTSPNVVAGKQALTGGTLALANGSGPFGGLASNYTFSVKGSTGTITPATISLAGSKVYDGTTGFTAADFGTDGTIATGINGETLEVTGSGFVLSSNVSAGTQFLFTSGLGLANGSGLSSNYRISAFGGTGVITPATLTYVASDSGMTYGGTVSGLTGTVTGFVDGQDLADATSGKLTFTTGAKSTSNVGMYAIIGSGLTADHGNYVFQQAAVNSTAFTITPAMLTYVATANSMTYGASVPGLSGTVTGFVNGQNLADATTGTLSFRTTATSASNVGTYGIAGSGLTADNGNYVFQQAPTNATAFTVTPAALTVTANDADATYNGLTYSGGNGVGYSGFVNGQSASVLGGTLAYGGTSQGAVNAGTYTITAAGLTAQNYVITYAPGTLTINRAALTVTADDETKSIGQTEGFSGTEFTSDGLQNGETIGSVTLSSFGAGSTASVGSYEIAISNATGGTFDANNYAITYVPGTLNVQSAPGGYSASQYATPQVNTPTSAVAINFQPTSASLPLIGVTRVSTVANNTTGNNNVASNGHRRGRTDTSQNIEPAGGRNALLWPVSQFDRTQYTPGALPTYAAQASQATVLTVIARAEADNRQAPKIDLFWHDNHSDWSALHASTVKFVKFTDGSSASRQPGGDNGFAFVNGKTDLVALLKHGPVMLGAAGTFVVPETPAPVAPNAGAKVVPNTSAPVAPGTSAPVVSGASTKVVPNVSAKVVPADSTKVLPGTSTKTATAAPSGATASVPTTTAVTPTKPVTQTPPTGALPAKADGKPAVVNVVSREWLLVLEVRTDGKSLLAVDPVTGQKVVLAFDPAHHTVGAVTGIVDPKTNQVLPLGPQVPAFVNTNINVPPAAWAAVKSFTPASYFAVSM